MDDETKAYIDAKFTELEGMLAYWFWRVISHQYEMVVSPTNSKAATDAAYKEATSVDLFEVTIAE